MTKKKKIQQNVYPLELILVSIIGVTIISRTITYLVLIKGALPISLFAHIGNFRLHHFVYGNILILITSFLAIGLGIRRHKNLFAIFYGIGLGLVLDEFLLWMGDTRQLGINVLFIPYSITVVSIASLIIATIIMYRLYKK
ncbi:MAG: hypothetical protein AAB622_03340 [Patescibacteria group bacterium]